MTKDFDNIDRDFDSRVRSMMEEGSMELPSGMWSAIEGRLDADAAKAVSVFARRRRRIAVWGGSFAAAAAIALAVIFGGRTSGGDTLLAGQSSTRVSEPNHNQSLTNCSTGNDTGHETSVVSVGFSVAEGAEGARHVAAAYEIPSVAGDS
ncbi:MAG: hypothetical protein HUJ94_03185, partial [Bacteroidales bacterium]|nr:hypothetical protein [Bacteroidales bacterium]